MNLRDQIKSVKDSRLEKVHVPEWECDVFIKSLTAEERHKLDNAITKDNENFAYLTLCASLADEEGNLLFSFPEDVGILKDKNFAVIWALYLEAIKVGKMRLEDVEDALKNLNAVR